MDKLHLYDKILAPLVTEKSTNLSEQNKIVFKVPTRANKKNFQRGTENLLFIQPQNSFSLFLFHFPFFTFV